ncbi:MAG: Coenzyme F420 hydrogenase/dehydrogenase, beta subunit C-terminal domain [Myxococcota bacterium]
MRNWTNEEIQRYLGTHLDCYLTHAKDDSIRNGAASGGTTSALLISMLEQGFVDGALVWRMVYDRPDPHCEPFIATTREEVLAARGSKYTAVKFPKEALPLIKAFDGKLAVLTLPCDASYLRRKIKATPAIGEKIGCIITLFCGHNSEPELTKIITRRHGLTWDEVETFKYRTGSWRGRLTILAKDGREVDIPTRTFTHYQNLHLFSERKCLNCTDHFGVSADIATGDIWSLDAKKHDVKPTLMVARTEVGQKAAATVLPELEAKAVPASVVVNGNSRGMSYHYHISARAKAGKRFGIKIGDPLRLPVTPLDEAIATIGIFNFWLSHNEKYSKYIEKVPMKAIEAYIYFFKGLQQLNLFLYRPFPPTDKYSIIGATLIGNRGAEAMLTTTVGKLREKYPDARFVVHSYFPERDRELCNDLGVDIVSATPAALVFQHLPFAVLDRTLRAVNLGFPRTWMPRAVRELKESRVLLDVFGVSYSDGREKFLPFNILSNLPAMMMGVPVVKLSQGLGKFEGRVNRTVGKWMLGKCKKVFARGARSLEMVRDLRLGDNEAEAADIAFSYEDSFSLTEENPAYEKELCAELEALRAEGDKVLTLSVSSVVSKKCTKKGIDYEHEMAQVAKHFLREGYAVLLFPNATRQETQSTHNNDLPIIADIQSRIVGMDTSKLVGVSKDLNTAALRRVLAKADYLVASRFHAMVAGLCLGIPTMVLGWGHKYAEVLAQFGISDQAYDFSTLDHASLIERIERFIDRAPLLQRRILENLPAVRASSAKQFEWLVDFVAMAANVCTPDDAEDAAPVGAAAPAAT